MALVTLDEAKLYLRVDSVDEDTLIQSLLDSAEILCMDVARTGSAEEMQGRLMMRVAILYALGYLYEHREEADYHDLMMTLRNLLFSIREGAF